MALETYFKFKLLIRTWENLGNIGMKYFSSCLIRKTEKAIINLVILTGEYSTFLNEKMSVVFSPLSKIQ